MDMNKQLQYKCDGCKENVCLFFVELDSDKPNKCPRGKRDMINWTARTDRATVNYISYECMACPGIHSPCVMFVASEKGAPITCPYRGSIKAKWADRYQLGGPDGQG